MRSRRRCPPARSVCVGWLAMCLATVAAGRSDHGQRAVCFEMKCRLSLTSEPAVSKRSTWYVCQTRSSPTVWVVRLSQDQLWSSANVVYKCMCVLQCRCGGVCARACVTLCNAVMCVSAIYRLYLTQNGGSCIVLQEKHADWTGLMWASVWHQQPVCARVQSGLHVHNLLCSLNFLIY